VPTCGGPYRAVTGQLKPTLGGLSMRFLSELWSFLWGRKHFWLTPIVVMIVLFVATLLLSPDSVVPRFVYRIF